MLRTQRGLMAATDVRALLVRVLLAAWRFSRDAIVHELIARIARKQKPDAS
jgi:hypothetical protein